MALIGTLRNKMGKIVVGAIMVTMVAFIGTDLIGNSNLLGGGQDQDIAEIAGTTISNTQFQSKVDELSYNFALNAGRNPLQQEITQIRNQAWNALIMEKAYQSQFDELGLEVTNEELIDMVQGANISPQIKQFFGNPQTGEFDKANVTNFLASLQEAQPQQRNSWISFEQSLIPNRLVEKYNNLLAKTNYASKHEGKNEHISQSANASIEYVYVPFLGVPDSTVTVTDSELEKYIDANTSEFKREETRSLEYVTFSIEPSAADSAVAREEIADLKASIVDVSNDSSFVSINSDDPYSFISYNDENLPDSLVGKEAGFVTEVELINGAYEFSKLSRIDEVKPDSAVYRVAKIRKSISLYISDETINEVYRKADLFAASAGNLEEFRNLAKEQNHNILLGNKIEKNSQRVGRIAEARSLALWLYNEAETGAVSDVKEINDQYIVAAMTSQQDDGVANLDDVRNQVERKVRNQKKSVMIIKKFENMDRTDLSSLATSYGDEAKNGTADFQMFANNISGIGYAPEAIGLAFAIEEEEITNAFAVQDGVMVMKLTGKDIPADLDDYSSYSSQLAGQQVGPNALIADFPLSYFRVFVSRKVDDAVKEFAEIEDMRYKFF